MGLKRQEKGREGGAVKPTTVFGYQIDSRGKPVRKHVDTGRDGDYGCDPVDGGMFRMVPSGDIVDREEMRRRLDRLDP